MKKIIFSNYDDKNNPFYGGGGAVAIHEVARYLAHSFEVVVITGKYTGSINEIIDGVVYKRIGIAALPAQLAQLVFQFLLPIYVVKESFDIWIESFTPPFSTAFLPLFTQRPVIGLAHLLGGKQMYEKYKIPFHWLEALGLRYYKKVICIAPYQKQQLLSKNKNLEIFTIPNGISAEDLPEVIPLFDRKHILFLGRIDIYQKGLDLLVQSIAKIKDRLNNQIIIAGVGTKVDEGKLKDLIAEHGLQSSFEFVGRVEGEKKKELLRGALCMVLPSRVENFAISALEAFAHGAPVLAFDIPGLNWFGLDVSVKVGPFDTDKFAEELVLFTKSTTLRNTLGGNAFHFAKGFTWDKVAPQYKQVIEQSL